MQARQVGRVNAKRLGFAVRQQANERAGGEVCTDKVGRQHRDPGPGERGAACDGGFIALQWSFHGYPERLALSMQTEFGAAHVGVGDASVLSKVVRRAVGSR